MISPTISYEDFKSQWLEEVLANNPSTVELGNRFSKKIITHWLDNNTDDIIFCDGSGDGGIDIAYLQREDSKEDNTNDGDTWYLVQSKHGSAFAGTKTLLVEAQKIIDTIDGKNKRLSSLTSELVERLQTFKSSASSKDKLILVFATHDPLNEDQKRALNDIKNIGRARFGDLFDTDAVSIETIYQRIKEDSSSNKKYLVPFTANLVPSGNDLLVGSIKLTNLYQFLKNYKTETGDLDLIYEKNVRKFLGSRKKVNAGIADTLREKPERFGLYNNGITLVVEDFKLLESDKYELTEPYIVNGCQTTRTIWEVLYKKLEAGGTGTNTDLENWKSRLNKGIVVVKVVKVGSNGEELLTNTTRYTNSQNTVGQKDFIALEGNFKLWAKEMEKTYNIFLEIQRGDWDSREALYKMNRQTNNFDGWANAFDLIKVYGAGWMAEPGPAFGKSAPFTPGGTIFKRIVENKSFDVKDLYASFLLQNLSKKIGFGREAKEPNRARTRHLFYFVITELLKDCISYVGIETSPENISTSVISVFSNLESDSAKKLSEAALNVIDDYLDPNKEDSIFNEPGFTDEYNFLKLEKLGKGNNNTPKLWDLISFTRRDIRRPNYDQQSTRDIIKSTILTTNTN